MNYRIAEIFLSIQGEGSQLGVVAAFVRFAGCNLACSFCDTAHEASPREMTLESVLQEIHAVCFERGLSPKGLPCVFTGGEPLLQLDLPLVEGVHDMGMTLHMETNGSIDAVRKSRAQEKSSLGAVLRYFDEVTVSPKVLPLSQAVLLAATTFKVLIPTQGFSLSDVADVIMKTHGASKKTLILQPVTPRGGIDTWSWKANISEAVAAAVTRKALYNETWRVVPQTHVLMKVR